MGAVTPKPSKLAAFLVGFMTISPFVVALDLAFHIFPDLPAIQTMRSATLLAKVMWIALAPLGVATVLLLLRRPVIGFILSVLFALNSAVAGYMLWQQTRPFGVALVVIACVLAGIGARQARSNNSFKPNPLRGSA